VPSIQERYILLSACLLLIIPFGRIIQAEYSSPHKKTFRVPKAQFTRAFTQLKDARLSRNTDALVVAMIGLSSLYSKDGDSSSASMLLNDILQDEVETRRQRVDVLAALGDVYRDKQGEEGLKLARKSYLGAIDEARLIDDKPLSGRLLVKLINLCYLKASDDFAREADRIAAIREADRTIKVAGQLAEDIDSLELQTAIKNYSMLIGIEEHRLGLTDKATTW